MSTRRNWFRVVLAVLVGDKVSRRFGVRKPSGETASPSACALVNDLVRDYSPLGPYMKDAGFGDYAGGLYAPKSKGRGGWGFGGWDV